MIRRIDSAEAGPPRVPTGLAVGSIIVALVVAMGLLSLAWTPGSATAVSIPDRLQPPSLAHWLGTDRFGHDVASMVMVGARNSLSVSLVAVAIGLIVGVPLGLAGAAWGGWRDQTIMRLTDVVFAFPALLLAAMIAALLGPGALNAMIAIGIFNVPVFTRVARGAALPVWARDYALAARATGRTTLGITLAHVLPNIANTVVVQAAIQFSLAVLAEAALSYFGLGAPPPEPTWGRMLSDAATLISLAPWLAIVPGVAIMVTVVGLNLVGDGLRDLRDPRLR